MLIDIPKKKKEKKEKKIKKVNKRVEERKLDEMWKKKVKERDKYMCQVCQKKVDGKNCQAHHILPRGIKGCRWDIENGITLCYQHHKVGHYSAHLNAIWFAFWFKTNKPTQFRYIVNKLVELDKK